MAGEILLSSSSRYKDTLVYDGELGPEFALMESPSEFGLRNSEYRQFVVGDHDLGFLDRIAALYFGPGQESLWWIIALVNNIMDPEADMYVGQVLVIPSTDSVRSFMSRGGRG